MEWRRSVCRQKSRRRPFGAPRGSEFEHVGDRILHDSVSTLFMARADPLEVIRWKDIHESLEEAMNACEYAANVLEAIVVKNR